MTQGLYLFISSGIFGIGIAIVYWFSSHAITGTMLLGIMALALSFVAGSLIVAEREAQLAGDRPQATRQEYARERIRRFITRSSGPFLAAVAARMLPFGAVYNWPLAIASFFFLIGTIGLLVRESR